MNQAALYDTKLYELVRKVGAGFSARAQDPGFHVVHTADKYGGSTKIFEKSFIGTIFGSHGQTHYYVKRRNTPLVINTWSFHWSEGTSAISLDFGATFQLRANGPQSACALVKAIHGHVDPSAALHGIIDDHLHTALAREFSACDKKGFDFLSLFNSHDARIGESRSINEEVSRAVCYDLGIGEGDFRIGFLLRNTPPFLVEVSNKTEFTLEDSKQAHTVKTEAQLKLRSYQSYKKSGLDTEDAIKAAMSTDIAAVVRKLLFGQKYYEIVETFQDPNRSINTRMRKAIQAAADAIGYDVVMFQTYPDFAALKLLSDLRIDMDGPGSPEASRWKYYLRHSGYVHVEFSFNVKARDFKLLHHLISPGVPDVTIPIIQRVQQICGDEIRKDSRKQFNLEFQAQVVPQLTEAIQRGLAQDGLATEIIKINQLPTEEAARYRAITTQTSPFSIIISAQANAGDADKVEMSGHIEVTGIDADADESWDKFESKDFGFRRDSVHDDDALRRMAQSATQELLRMASLAMQDGTEIALTPQRSRTASLAMQDGTEIALTEQLPPPTAEGLAAHYGTEIKLSGASPLPTAERRNVAIQLELLEIRKRVEATLRERLSKLPNLAAAWRGDESSRKVIEFAQRVASGAIQSEFGLKISLQGVERRDTAGEVVNRLRRQQGYELMITAAAKDKELELKKLEMDAEGRLALQGAVQAQELEQWEATRELPERIAKGIAADSDAMANSRISLHSARQLLAQPSSPEALPWDKTSNHDGESTTSGQLEDKTQGGTEPSKKPRA